MLRLGTSDWTDVAGWCLGPLGGAAAKSKKIKKIIDAFKARQAKKAAGGADAAGDANKAEKAADAAGDGAKAADDVKKDVNIDPDKYPESAQHIKEAQEAGHPAVLTKGDGPDAAKANRKEATGGAEPAGPGKQNDEYPPAMSKEGGKGASVKPIGASDNMGSGASLGNQTRDLKPGDKFRVTTNKKEKK